MESSFLEKIPGIIAELNYKQKQTLLFGGDFPPYPFALPDGSHVYECGKGIGSLYRAVRAIEKLSSPKAEEMRNMLEEHKADEGYMLKYLRHQVEQYAPEGTQLRTKLLEILNNEMVPSESRIKEFMDYMDGLMAVVARQEYVTLTTYAMLRARVEIMERVRKATDKASFRMTAEYVAKLNSMIDISVLTKADIEEIQKAFKDAEVSVYEVLFSIIETAGLDVDDVAKLMNDALQKGDIGAYAQYAVVAAKSVGASIPKEKAKEWFYLCMNNGGSQQASDMLAALLNGNGTQCEAQDIVEMMEAFTPDDQGREAQWDYYAKAALAIVERGAPVQGGTFALQCPDIDGVFSEADIERWIVTLKKQGRYDLVAKIEIMAFSKGYEWVDIISINESITNACSSKGLDGTEFGVELHAYMTAHLPDGSVSIEDVGEWINEASEFNKSENVHMIAVAAVNRGIGERSHANYWVKAFKEHRDSEGSCLIAIAAITKEGGVSGLTVRDMEEWMLMSEPFFAYRILEAIMQSGNGDRISPAIIKNICDRSCGADSVNAIVGITQAAMLAGNDAVLRQMDESLGVSDIRGVVEYVIEKGHFLYAAGILEVAVDAGKIATVIKSEDIEKWGNAATKEGFSSIALEIGLIARDAGIAVPSELISEWHAACFDSKTDESAVLDAGALWAMYRCRQAVSMLPEEQRRALEQEINDVYQKIIQHQDSLKIKTSMPLSEVMQMIDAIIYC